MCWPSQACMHACVQVKPAGLALCDAFCMRRIALGGSFVILLLLDLSAITQLLAVISLTAVFGSIGHGAFWLPLLVILLAVTGALLWLTVVVGKALLGARNDDRVEPSFDAFGREEEPG